LAEELKKDNKNIQIEFVKSSGGAFEVSLDGELIFSKLNTGRFPSPEEIKARL